MITIQGPETGQVSDGYHTFDELYEYRMLYNAAFVNLCGLLPNSRKEVLYDVHKSKRHSDGELCFGGGWFVVVAQLPTGQVTNHYKMEHWDLFKVPERELAADYDGHTPAEAAERIKALLLEYKDM